MNLLTIARRELLAYFYSPIAYVVLALFLLIQGIYFWLFLTFLSQPGAPPGAVMSYFFGGTILFWMSTIFSVSLLSMRLLAEERRSGTFETLLTAPVRDIEVVLGKYLACLLFYLLLWLPEVIYVALLWRFAGRPDLGPIAAGYLGAFLVGAALMSFGLLASALTRNQIIAATLAFVFSWALVLVGVAQDFVTSQSLRDTLGYVHMFKLMEDFGRGIVDTRHVVFLLTLTVLGLYATTKVVELKKGA
ncbi:MAG TPA: ABC transporter permease [Polyangia bacterium]|nr:ABC transporter permease [Polyangia bacterium]